MVRNGQTLDTLSDNEFDKIFPPEIRALSQVHWTPVAIARRIAKFLVSKPGTRVLDVGAGPGKFCMVGALCTPGQFTGIEQREGLVKAARETLARTKITNVHIIEANILDIVFSQYDAFYLYNPFTENLLTFDKIDDTVQLSRKLYWRYTSYVLGQLAAAPLGTRIATYWNGEIPLGYSPVETTQPDQFVLPGAVKFWRKTQNVSAADLVVEPFKKIRYDFSACDFERICFDEPEYSPNSWKN